MINKCEINLGFLVMHKKLPRIHNHIRAFVWQVGMGDQMEGIILVFKPGAHLGSSLKLVIGFMIVTWISVCYESALTRDSSSSMPRQGTWWAPGGGEEGGANKAPTNRI